MTLRQSNPLGLGCDWPFPHIPHPFFPGRRYLAVWAHRRLGPSRLGILVIITAPLCVTQPRLVEEGTGKHTLEPVGT